jgi:hypothetical protein
MIKKITMNLFKRTISVFSLFMFLFTAFVSAQSVDLVATVDEVPPFTNGQTFNYSIMSTGNPYNSIRLKLIYDPSIIQLNSLTPVYAFDFTPVNDTATPGLVKYEATSLSGNITTDEIILNIEFEVLDNTQTISIAHNYDAADGTVVVNSGGNDILGTANDILLETLSIQNKELNFLSVYPNPADNEIVIKNTHSRFSIVNIKIYTIDGKIVLNQVYTKNSINNESLYIDTSSLKNALYFMDVIDETGTKSSFKILVSH